MLEHHALVKKMNAEMTLEMRRHLNNGSVWEDRRRFIHRVVDPNTGDQLKGIWTHYADEVFQLVACGYVNRDNWQSYFAANVPRPSIGGDIEAYAASRDSDQQWACMEGLRAIISRLPRR